MEDLGLDVLGGIAEGVDEDAATDRAVRTGVAGLHRPRELVGTHLGQRHLGREPQGRQARRAYPSRADLEELAPGCLHDFSLGY